MRPVFEATDTGDLTEAATVLNQLLDATGARPRLDPLATGGYHVHFHGSTDGLATGWAAGCATGLALAIGTDLAGRLGVLRGRALRPRLRRHVEEREAPVLLDGVPEPHQGGGVPPAAGQR